MPETRVDGSHRTHTTAIRLLPLFVIERQHVDEALHNIATALRAEPR